MPEHQHTLHWTNAYTARLSGTKISQDVLVQKYTHLRERLQRELPSLPALTLTHMKELTEDLDQILPKCKRFKNMLVLGIGGSALGARALQKAFASEQDGPEYSGPSLWIADNVCAATFDSWLSKLPAKDTVVVCISKSGGTIETISQYFLCIAWLKAHMGEYWHKHMIVVTDKHKGFLREEVCKHGFDSMVVPDNLGGRYSCLSAVGLLPAAFMGIDWQGLLCGASKVSESLVQNAENIFTHPAFNLALWAYELEKRHYSELIFFSYIPKWATFGPWFAQLWAESLGKEGKGIMPISATGVTDQHSVNQMFLDGPRNKGCLFLSNTYVETDDTAKGQQFAEDLPPAWSWLSGKYFGELLHAEALGTRMGLIENSVPLVHVEMGKTDAQSAGSLMMLLQIATIFTGWLLEINPLDQPAVELGKRLANARLGAPNLDKENADLAAYMAQTDKTQVF